MQLRYGILSTSSIAPRFIAAVREAGAGEIVALSSRSIEKAKEKAALWDIPTAYGCHNALLADENVNIVYISNINTQHYPWAKAALEHGKHVICEKPCTTTAVQTEELYRLAREKGLFFMEAQKMLFLPAVRELRRRIDAGELGDIQMADLSHSFSPGYNDWVFDREAGGGPLLSSGIYAMELLLWLFGDFACVHGVKTSVENGVECQYILSGQTESGVLFCAKNSTQTTLQSVARIHGTKGWAELPQYWKARSVTFHVNGKEPETVEFPCEHELVYEAQHIAECMDAGSRNSPVVTAELSVKGIAALEKIKSVWE